MAFSDKNAIFRPYFELEAIARQSVEASRKVSCAYFGNIDRNSGYFSLPIFLAVHPSVHAIYRHETRRQATTGPPCADLASHGGLGIVI